jgi:hypothetical protein
MQHQNAERDKTAESSPGKGTALKIKHDLCMLLEWQDSNLQILQTKKKNTIYL